jgi:hypothetical protein
MLDRTKKALRSWLFSGLFAVDRTDERSILDLIEKLRPQDCGVDLIRVGGNGDGGYLIPDDLAGIEYCFSPGVGDATGFEDELADRGIRSYLADYSADLPANHRPEFVFDKKYLAAADREIYFTLKTWKDKYLGDYAGDLLLQMDIEGTEYEVILNTPESLLNQFRIVVIEFHFLDRLLDPFAFNLISSCFEKLLDSFYVVHLHPNNCCRTVTIGAAEIPKEMEFTFFRRTRAREVKPQIEFPHRLDADNVPHLAPLALPKCWYARE